MPGRSRPRRLPPRRPQPPKTATQTDHPCGWPAWRGLCAARGSGAQRRDWSSLSEAPLWYSHVAAWAIAVANRVRRVAIGTKAVAVRAHEHVRRRLSAAKPALKKAPSLGISKHRNLPDERDTPTNAFAAATLHCGSSTYPGHERQSGRLSGCHASPFAPTRLADGFGEGVTGNFDGGVEVSTPQRDWVPRSKSRAQCSTFRFGKIVVPHLWPAAR